MNLLQHSVTRLGLSGALLALGSLAVSSCGDDSSSPPDARRPPDASQALDASRPPDGGGSDGGGSDGAVSSGCEDLIDRAEPNNTAEAAALLTPTSLSNNPSWISGDWSISACLGKGNEDWYRIEASQLMFDTSPDFEGTASIQLRMVIDGTSVCAGMGGCSDQLLPDAPENTVTVAVYRASDKQLVTMSSNTHGALPINGRNEAFTGDLLVQVSGPPEALYSYRLNVFIDVTGSEDECEC